MDPRDVLAAARVRVVTRHPYLAAALFQLRPVERPGLGTLAVDAGWRLWYDSETILEWGSKQTAAVVAHEVMHCVRDHFGRTGDRDRKLFNIAGDAEINDDLLAAGWELPQGCVTPKGIGAEPGLTAEEYYEHLRKKQGSKGQGELEAGEADVCSGRCGGCAGNPHDFEKEDRASGEKDEAAPPVTGGEKEIVRRQVAEAVRAEVERSRGTVPAGLRAWADAQLRPPKLDWRKVLAAQVRASIGSAAGMVDYTYRKPARRSAGLRATLGRGAPILPSLHQPVPRVVVVLDQSGSMGTSIERAVSETVGVAKATGSDVLVLGTEMDVREATRVRTARQAAGLAKTGGGTDMRPGIERASKERADVIVVVTDGWTPWPDKPTKAKAIACLVQRPGKEWPVPPWMKVVEAVDE